jgi:signal transduction histidine kinase
MLRELKAATGGSEFLVLADGRAISSTLPAAEAQRVAGVLTRGGLRRYAASPTELHDLAGRSIGQLWALRSFEAVERRASDLRRTIVLAWAGAMALGLALSYALARKIVQPVRELNAAAQEVAKENYGVRVSEDGADELGVLGRTFNRMCASIEHARAELIRREQITAVGRLAASIAHDLRNPLAAIQGGAEMVAEFDLPSEQVKETGRNMYAAAQRMNQMLGELSHVAKRKAAERSRAPVAEMVGMAVESQAAKAEQQGVTLRVTVPEDLAVVCERSRVERVFVNLISNALEAMQGSGEIAISAARVNGAVVVEVKDTGPGVPAEIRNQLFQPFVTAGKRNGLGLGLALARQTMLDHGGDLELAESAVGARFRVRLQI